VKVAITSCAWWDHFSACVTMALQAMHAEAATQRMKGMWDGIAATHSNFVQVSRTCSAHRYVHGLRPPLVISP